ncbi:MAG: SpoVR family protein, partial [Calditrichia bacterium]
QALRRRKNDRDLPGFPGEPRRDILAFLIEFAPVPDWQKDILSIIRKEAYYFAPQGMTKIMNEGWATYWHSKIMTTRALGANEIVDYAEHHSGTVANHPGRLNPYRIGVLLFKDIEDRWNKGRFGKDYEECDSVQKKRTWDLKLGKGREKIFEVRTLYSDLTFIDAFLTEDFCREHKLFSFAYNKRKERYEIESRNFKQVKQRLLQNLTHLGQPFITVQDANFHNRGELLLTHAYDGVELDQQYCTDTLKNLQSIWKRPVYIETTLKDEPIRLSFDGEQFKQRQLSASIS